MLLEALLDAARRWHVAATDTLGATLHGAPEERRRASVLVRLAEETYADALRIVVRMGRRVESLRVLTRPLRHDATKGRAG